MGNYKEKKQMVNKMIKEGKWNHSNDMSKDNKTCRVTTEKQEFPYGYCDCAHACDCGSVVNRKR